MKNPRASVIVPHALAMLALAATFTSPLIAQNGRPNPQQPESQAPPDGRPQPQPADPAEPQENGNEIGPIRTRPVAEGKVTLAFNDVAVDEKITAFIAESTGKVVMPVNLAALKAKKITLMNDEPVDRALALDLLMTALRLNGVGIVETPQLVILDLIDNIKPLAEIPVIPPTESVMGRVDTGNIVIKMYRLRKASAETVYEQLSENVPTYASLIADANSNQITLYGDVGTAQRLQRMIDLLDTVALEVKVETFTLKHADAQLVSDQIWDLFDDSGQGQAQRQQRQQNQRNQQPGGRQPQQQPGAPTAAGVTTPGTAVPLRVSVNSQQNQVTVAAEPAKVDAIARLVRNYWDLPIPPENSKVYKLVYADPLKVRDMLQSLLGAGGSSGGTSGGRAGAPRGVQQQQFGQQGGGSGVGDVIGDIYRVEAFPDQNSVIVVSRTKESLEYLDSVIKSIDQPSSAGLPMVVELKHANAFELADELNVLLAESGTGRGLDRPGTGLTGEDNLAGGGQDSTGTGATSDTAAGGEGTIEFPWQTAQPRDDQSEPSPLIGKVRIVPIVRQNALAVLAPTSQQPAVRELIESFDRPGRQVMISAIIAEVELTDDLALGVRFSSGDLFSALPDNAIGGSSSFEGTMENDIFDGFFDASVLDTTVDLNVLIQALRQKTNVRILQEPRVFTADNQEAIFFDGQDVPFITNTNTSDISGFQQSIEPRAVGVQLDVRPRITAQRDVDMEINLILSSIVPGQIVGGNFIVDRRETTTKVIVKNGQTIVLSGILTDTESQITRGLPLLSDLPWIGDIFKSHENNKRTTELIAFITPQVVDNPSENDTNFNAAARERLRSLSLPLKEQAKQREAIRDRILAPKTPNSPVTPTIIDLPGNGNGNGGDDESHDSADDVVPPEDHSNPNTGDPLNDIGDDDNEGPHPP